MTSSMEAVCSDCNDDQDEQDRASSPKNTPPSSSVAPLSEGGELEGRCPSAWNPHLKRMPSDYLYHLALGTAENNLADMFGDVRFVCVGGTAKRMEDFAYYVGRQLAIKLPTGVNLQDITQNGHRYSMFKIGPILSVTHGMGSPSLSILLHELFKLIHYAKCKDVTFLRLGTSGGLGVEPGSLVVTSTACDGLLRPYYEQMVLGKLVQRPAVFNQNLVDSLLELGAKSFPSFKTVTGTTMCTADFYEGQARLDGAFCSYTETDKINYLKSLSEKGVVNIEMESVTIGAMCHAAGLDCAIICVTLLNRLLGDQVTLTDDQYIEYQLRPQMLAAQFIKSRLEGLPL
ncbi:Uridine phosphorylase 1 [Halotydeus destructor]|nr:Uridine phosphorylase 1 [Halotydeus destructor]